LTLVPVRKPNGGPFKYTARWGEAVGFCIADGFAVCGFRPTLASYLVIARDDGWTPLGTGLTLAEFHDGSNFKGSRDHSRASFLLRYWGDEHYALGKRRIKPRR
jgi:hypothetical protein